MRKHLIVMAIIMIGVAAACYAADHALLWRYSGVVIAFITGNISARVYDAMRS